VDGPKPKKASKEKKPKVKEDKGDSDWESVDSDESQEDFKPAVKSKPEKEENDSGWESVDSENS
jgi:hypothetical protein